MDKLIKGDVMIETDDFPGFVEKVREVVRQEFLFSACSLLSHEIVLGVIDSDSPKMPKNRSLRDIVNDMLLLTPEEAAVTTIAFDASHLDFSMRLKRVDETHYLGHVKNGAMKQVILMAVSDLDEVTLYPRWKRQQATEGGSNVQGLREEHWHNLFDEPDAIVELSEAHDGIVRSVLHERKLAEWIVRLQPTSPFLRFHDKTTDAVKNKLGPDYHRGPCGRDDIDALLTEWLETHTHTRLPAPLDADDLDKTYDELDPSRFITLDEEMIEHIVTRYKEKEQNNVQGKGAEQ